MKINGGLLLLSLLSFLISIPVFVFFRKNVFDLNWEIPIDKITLFFGILFAFWFIIYNLKKYLIYSFTIYYCFKFYFLNIAKSAGPVPREDIPRLYRVCDAV